MTVPVQPVQPVQPVHPLQAVTPPRSLKSGEPYCGACGYPLLGLHDSARCPECGGPLVDVLRRVGDGGALGRGHRYTSAARVFGMPLVHVAFGSGPDGLTGKARGFIAIGDEAMGVVALGGVARGVIAIGGAAFGVFSFGGAAVGLVSAVGGGAVSGLFSLGGGAFSGGVALGGGVLGLLAASGGNGSFMNSGIASAIGASSVTDVVMATGVTVGALLVATLTAVGAIAMASLGRSAAAKDETSNPYR